LTPRLATFIFYHPEYHTVAKHPSERGELNPTSKDLK